MAKISFFILTFCIIACSTSSEEKQLIVIPDSLKVEVKKQQLTQKIEFIRNTKDSLHYSILAYTNTCTVSTKGIALLDEATDSSYIFRATKRPIQTFTFAKYDSIVTIKSKDDFRGCRALHNFSLHYSKANF